MDFKRLRNRGRESLRAQAAFRGCAARHIYVNCSTLVEVNDCDIRMFCSFSISLSNFDFTDGCLQFP